MSESRAYGGGVPSAVQHDHGHRASPSLRASETSSAAERAVDDADGALNVSSSRRNVLMRFHKHRSHRHNAIRSTGDTAVSLGVEVSITGLELCCDGVSVQHHQRDGIEDVSCLFHGGRVTAIVNCCGTHSASTLLSVLAGRLDSTAGNTVLNGIPVSASKYQAQMCFLEASEGTPVESSDLLAELTVRENLQYASALRVADSAQAYSVDEVLQQLLLRPHEGSKVKNCSLYVQRRTAVGRDLLLNPSVLLLDEPLEGLATHESQQYLTILSKLAAPSAADAEARKVMREVMRANAVAPAGEYDTSTGAITNVSRNCVTSDVSLYTPRYSRLNPGFSHLSSWPPPGASSTSTTASTAAATDMCSATRSETRRIVVLSMVQPRWALLQYVHDIVLLERSSCVFVGSVQDMLAVTLPTWIMRDNMLLRADDGAGRTDAPDRHKAVAPAADRPSPPQSSSQSVSADPDDATSATIHLQRLGEQILHALYRLATGVTTYPVEGTEGREAAEDVTSMIVVPGFSSVTSTKDPSGSLPPRMTAMAATLPVLASSSPSFDVEADGPRTTALGQLYLNHQLRFRTSVAAYMETCAMGLLELPEAFHRPPCGIVQLLHLLRFGFLELRQNFIWRIFMMVCGLALTAVLAALYGRQGSQEGMQNRVGIIFFLVSCVVLQSVLSLDALRREYAVFQRYSARGYYGAWIYLVVHVITAALWRFGLASFVALVVFVLSNFGEPWHEYRSIFELSVILAVTSFCSHLCVWFLCSWLPSGDVGRFLAFTGYTLNIILAGLVLNLSTMPNMVQSISFLSVVRLAYESCILTQFIGKSFGCPSDFTAVANTSTGRASMPATLSPTAHSNRVAVSGLLNADAFQHTCASAACTSATPDAPAAGLRMSCYTGTEYAEFLGFSSSRRWSNVGLLAAMSAALLLGSWIMMALYRPRRRFYRWA